MPSYLMLLAPLFLFIHGAQAATGLQPPTVVTPVFRPLVVAREAEQPIRLTNLVVQAQVAGGLATTQVTLSLHNPNLRVLEGELQFPLLEGQSVTGFALESPEGQMLPAVAVAKVRGQEVFESIVRRGADPALLEQTEGNNYKLRVYPLPAGKARRVTLEISELLMPDAAGHYHYRPPVALADAEKLSLTLRVHGLSAGRIVLPVALRRAEVLTRHGDAWVMFERAGGARLPVDMALHWPAPEQAAVFSDLFEADHYFHADIPLPTTSLPRPAPRTLALLWDASGSGAARDHAREFELLDAYFRALGELRVELIVARDVAEAPMPFQIRNGDWSALRATLSRLHYDGASNPAAWIPPAGHDLALLFSDGLGNWGTGAAGAAPVPLYAISAAASANPERLRRLAESAPGAGQYLDLLQRDTAAALAELQGLRPRLELDDGVGVADVVAPSVYALNGQVRVAGRLTAEQALLRYRLRWPDGRVEARELPIRADPDGTALISAVAAKRWAGYRVAGLEAEVDLHRAEIERLGKRFGLVTSQTSLLALESLEDHLRYQILPPPGPWRTAYLERQVEGDAARGKQRDTHLDKLVKRFADQVAWWERAHPKGDKPQQEAPMREEAPTLVAAEARAGAERREASSATLQHYLLEPPRAAAPRRPRAQARMLVTTAAAPRPESEATTDSIQPSATIQLQPWQPDATYTRRLRAATDEQRYAIYLDERPGYANSTAFFLDAADIFFEKGQTALGLRVLSNLAEMNLESRQILRVLAYRLLRAGQVKLALPLLRRVCDLAPEEPQSWRDLGLALEADGKFQEALEALWTVASRPWDVRFPDIDLTALHELNALVARHPGLDARAVDPRLLRSLPVGLRAVMAWDADNTDIDLWVVDPNGEQTDYRNPASYQGGRMSGDFTGGYGPETFLLKDAKPGRYEIRANFYGHRQQVLLPYTTLMLRLTTGFGTPEQRDEDILLRLTGQNDQVLVGSIEVGAGKGR